MNRRKNRYLVECNMLDDFFNWYKQNYYNNEETPTMVDDILQPL